MKNVELIRRKVAIKQAAAFADLRIFISGTEGNTEVVERMRGPDGERMLGNIIEYILEQLGHETKLKGRGSPARRLASGRV